MKNDPQELARSIVVSSEKVKNYSVQFTKLGDLAYNEMLIIDYLGEFGDAPQKDIAKYHAISKQTINLSVTKLLKSGYVDLYQSPDNKKEKILRLTDKGNVMKTYSLFSRSKQYGEIIDTFGVEKAALLEILLKEYESIMGKVLTDAIETHKERARRYRILEKNEIEAWEGNRK